MRRIRPERVRGAVESEAKPAWGLLDCEHYFQSADDFIPILDRASFLVPPLSRTSILMAPGSGKSTLVRLLAGIESPRGGLLVGRRGDAVMLNYAGHLHPAMTGEENVRNIATIMGLDPQEVALQCQTFADLDEQFRRPVISYAATAKASLAFALNLQLPAKYLLVEDRLTLGDSRMRLKCKRALAEALQTKGLIMICSNPSVVRHVCDHHQVFKDGRFHACSTYAQAVEIYRTTLVDTAVTPNQLDKYVLQ
jgi:ABC-type polysaccharide/polyol phosphate transport system ATPase subunit